MPNTEYYNDKVVRQFLLAAAVWGIVGMSVGVLAAAQLAWPLFNFDTSWLTFSRIRPDHTFGVIFAFGGSAHWRGSPSECRACRRRARR